MERKFLIALSEHRVVGFLFLPYLADLQKKSDYYTLVERITNDDVRKRHDEFDEMQRKIVKLIEEYSDSELVRVFSKKRTTNQEFISGLSPEMITNHIRPYIERRLIKIVDLLKNTDIEIYYKNSLKQVYVSDRILVNKEPADAVFNFIRSADEFKYFLSISHQQEEMKLTNKPGVILVNEPCHLVIDDKLLVFKDIDGKKLNPFFKNEYVKVPKEREKEYLEKFVAATIKKYKVNCTGFQIKEQIIEPKKVLSLENDLSYLPVLKLEFDYGKNLKFYALEEDETSVTLENVDSEFVFYKTTRNKILEENAIKYLLNIGLQNNSTAFFRTNNEEINDGLLGNLINWINTNEAELNNEGFIVRQDFFEKKYFTQKIELITSYKQNGDWFDVHATVKLGNFEISFLKFRKNILEGKREYTLPDGQIVILPKEWFAKYSDMFYFGKTDGEHLLFKNYHANLIQQSLEISNKDYLNFFNSLTSQTHFIPESTMPLVNATLRHYQEDGYSWLYWLYKNSLGACLADDMGLGKTLQTLILLKKVTEECTGSSEQTPILQQKQLFDYKTGVPATLIVLPSSLIHNWYNEIQKFTPEFNVLKYIGPGRATKVEDFSNYHIILTTYGVVRNEFEQLKQYKFLYIILDESQTIKNPDSKIFQAVTELNSANRMVLTGTPIENSLTDLWSQIEFLNPGLLGQLNFFKSYFVTPIEKENNEVKRDKLKRLIQPFILRRTKKEVAVDLPMLSEQIRLCSMSDDQRNFYEEEKSKIRNEIIHAFDEVGVEKSTMIVLNALTKLRQIANHPAMVDNDYNSDSGKFDEVLTCLENMFFENHKVLIFSSFVKHLDLFKQFFEKNKMHYSMLTGETRNREAAIKAFQEEEDNKFFLISLKAGGVGLNLTAADYVFILDPWWNPAAEMQAINRAHRIGQTNNVFVYRFISAETVEEKIVKLQERKSELAELFINNNNPFKLMSKENIMELFE